MSSPWGVLPPPGRRGLVTVLAPLTAIALLLTLALTWVTWVQGSTRAWAIREAGDSDASVYVLSQDLSATLDLLAASGGVVDVRRAPDTEVLVTADTTLGATASMPSGDEVVVAGRLPRTQDEVVVDQGLARAQGIRVGSSVQVSTDSYSQDSEATSRSTVELTVVGLVAWTPPVFVNGYHRVLLTADGLSALGPALYVRLDLDLSPGTDSSHISDELTHRALSAVLLTHADDVSFTRDMLTDSGLLQTPVMAGLGTVVLVVGALSAHNALRTLTARRARSLALLRALGLRRTVLRRALRREAMLLGTVAAVVGTLMGLALALAGQRLARATAWDVLAPSPVPPPMALVLVLLVPVLVALVADLGPSHAGSQASLPALRAGRGEAMPPPLPWQRTVPALLVAAALALAAARVAALRAGTGWYLVGTSAPWPLVLITMCATLTTAALMVSSWRTLPATAWLVARPWRALVRRRDRPVVDLALGAIRARSARTGLIASALLMAVTLTVSVLTVQGCARATVLDQARADWAMDLEIRGSAQPGTGLTEAAATAGCHVEGVVVCLTAQETDVEVADDLPVPALALNGKDLARLTGATEVADLVDDGVLLVPSYVAEILNLSEGSQVTAMPGGPTLTVRITDLGLGTMVVSPGTGAAIAANTGNAPRRVLLARLDPSRPRASSDAVIRAVTSASPSQDRPWVQASGAIPSVADQLTELHDLGRVAGLTCLLLLLTVVVTMGGLARLEVVERSRERALLHALGLTRRQLRLMALTESGLVASVAAFAGVLLGTLGGWLTTLVLDTTPIYPLLRLSVAAVLLCGVVVPATVVAVTAVTAHRAARAAVTGPPPGR